MALRILMPSTLSANLLQVFCYHHHLLQSQSGCFSLPCSWTSLSGVVRTCSTSSWDCKNAFWCHDFSLGLIKAKTWEGEVGLLELVPLVVGIKRMHFDVMTLALGLSRLKHERGSRPTIWQFDFQSLKLKN
jgi:hypothetical protein